MELRTAACFAVPSCNTGASTKPHHEAAERDEAGEENCEAVFHGFTSEVSSGDLMCGNHRFDQREFPFERHHKNVRGEQQAAEQQEQQAGRADAQKIGSDDCRGR